MINDLKDSVEFITNEYDNVKKENKQLREEIEKLNKVNEKVVKIEKVQIEELKKATQQRQYDRNKNIEIIGVERKKEENLKSIVIKIAEKIGLDPHEVEHIDVMHRIPARKRITGNKKEKETENLSENIIIQFKERKNRDEWLKKKTRITNEDIYGGNNVNKGKVYINENLIPEMKRLIWQAKNKAKEKGWKFIWTKDGKILGRQKEGEKVIRINDEGDLNLII